MGRPHHSTSLTKYYVQTDDDGYVVAINHTGTFELDTVPLDLSQYDLAGEMMNTYKLVDGTLIQDPVKLAALLAKQEAAYNQERIAWLKKQLSDTDYIASRAFEEVMSLTNPLTWVTDAIKITIKYTKQYAEIMADRRSWIAELAEREKR